MRKSVAVMTIFSTLCFSLISCSVGPKPIVYGTDGCHFCSMTIVDTQHAAQLVTKKGKNFKFDAIECMMNHLKEVDNSTIELFLVNDYDSPGDLIDATTATYIRCEEIPSPMGEFLSAFDTKSSADEIVAAKKGELFAWEGLKLKFGLNF